MRSVIALLFTYIVVVWVVFETKGTKGIAWLAGGSVVWVYWSVVLGLPFWRRPKGDG